jgi:hypothetical protein
MEPARKKITWTPQSHLEAHCFGGMRENIIVRTTSSSQKSPPMEAEDGWFMLHWSTVELFMLSQVEKRKKSVVGKSIVLRGQKVV